MIIEVNNLSFSYQSTPVLNDVDFEVAKGEICAILGMNGAGKSTLLRCINRILKPRKGVVFLKGKKRKKFPGLKMEKRTGKYPPRQKKIRLPDMGADVL